MARQRHVYPTDEIAHLWAHQTQDSARNPHGNLYFEGDTIYSYGSHFPIARLVTNGNGDEAVLFNSNGYSNTTAGHKHIVRSAIRHLPVFEVDRPTRTPEQSAAEQLCAVETAIEELRAMAAPPDKGPALKKVKVTVPRPSWQGGSEEVKALGGKRLATFRGRQTWNIYHIPSGLGLGLYLSQRAARYMTAALDKHKIWDQIPADGKASREVLDKAQKLIAKAQKKYGDLADVNRHASHISRSLESVTEAIQALNHMREFFSIGGPVMIPVEIESALRPVAEQYEAERASRQRKRWAERDERRRIAHAEWERREEEFRTKLPGYLDRWRAGEYVPEIENRRYSYTSDGLIPTMLRIENDEVVTSRGARFPMSHAVRGLRLVRSVMATGREYRRNGHTVHLGHYPLDWIEPNGTVHAGCHVVTWDEISRLAPKLDAWAEEHKTAEETEATA